MDRLIAGSAYGLNNQVKTFSPLSYLHVEIADNARIALPAEHAERAVYVVSGSRMAGNQRPRPLAGRMPLPPDDSTEFIPLPEEPSHPA